MLTQGHDKSADYWAFGILVYELLCGCTPFEGRNQQRTFEKIVQSQKHLTFPKGFDAHSKSFVRRLLHPNASLRLGALQNGGLDVREHAFFITQSIDFTKLLEQAVPMRYLPPRRDASALAGQQVEPLDVDFEITAIVDEEYLNHFGDIHLINVYGDDNDEDNGDNDSHRNGDDSS